jgi:adenosylcobinamide kinase/adenosylcobinamide-phosphate guanylyltransferase
MWSNDLFSDGETYTESTQEYLRVLSGINAHVAALADCVCEVVYSVPIALKGELPCV